MTIKGQKQNQASLPKNLLESIRNLGTGIVSDAQEQIGFIKRNPNVDSLFEKEILQIPEKPRIRTREITSEERIVFSAKEEEMKIKIRILQEEARKMASAVEKLNQVIKNATLETPPKVGIYHENFLLKLISFIKSLTKRIEDSSVWLTNWHRRVKKIPFYWAQFKKSGSKFMLSSERYMATQAG